VTRLLPTAAALAAVGTTLALAACGAAEPTKTVTVGGTPAARTATTGTAAGGADLGGRNPFASTSPWNAQVQTLPADPNSAAMIRVSARQPVDASEQTYLQSRLTRRNLAINLTGWAPGVYGVGAGSPVKLICRQSRCGKVGDPPPDTLRLGADAVPDPGHDGWLVLVDEANKTVWDLWRARRAGNTLSYAFARRWRLDGSGVGPVSATLAARTPSIRGSGLPMLAGLIRPRELRAGRIPHALAIAIPGPASDVFVSPASTTNGLASRTKAIPEGARLRLRGEALTRLQRSASTRRSRNPGALTVAQALYTYGAIVVDRANAPTLYAQRNGNYVGYLRENALSELKLTDFDVLPLGRRRTDSAAPPEAR
jgi:hypothetical protein